MQVKRGSTKGFDSIFAGPKRIFVRAELYSVLRTLDMRRAPLIRLNLHNPWLRSYRHGLSLQIPTSV